MSSVKHKQALVFFSAGVGDAILLVPLVNELKKQNYLVTGLFTSPFNCESIFENTRLFNKILVKKTKPILLLYSLLHSKKYDLVFLNHFSFSQSNIYCANLLGKTVFTNYNHSFSLRSLQSVHVTEPIVNIHDALQNALLFNNNGLLSDLNFELHYTSTNKNKFKLPKQYIVIQSSSANNKAPYKNWDFKKWLELFKHLQTHSPNATIVLLGDTNELHLNEKINSVEYPNVISLIGKTTLNDVMEIIYYSQFYIGLDSGLMHIAVALGKPTFTIWGASNPTLYGYEWMGHKHKVVSLKLACAPCSSWINPNTSRVKDSMKCPDFKCIRDVSVKQVTEELDAFMNAI